MDVYDSIAARPYYSTLYNGPNADDYQPLIDWGFFTEPMPGANGRRFFYAQGKTLGVRSISSTLTFANCNLTLL